MGASGGTAAPGGGDLGRTATTRGGGSGGGGVDGEVAGPGGAITCSQPLARGHRGQWRGKGGAEAVCIRFLPPTTHERRSRERAREGKCANRWQREALARRRRVGGRCWGRPLREEGGGILRRLATTYVDIPRCEARRIVAHRHGGSYHDIAVAIDGCEIGQSGTPERERARMHQQTRQPNPGQCQRGRQGRGSWEGDGGWGCRRASSTQPLSRASSRRLPRWKPKTAVGLSSSPLSPPPPSPFDLDFWRGQGTAYRKPRLLWAFFFLHSALFPCRFFNSLQRCERGKENAEGGRVTPAHSPE